MTIRDLIRSYSDSFKNISDTPELDIRVIVCHFLGLEPAQLFLRMDDALTEDLLGKLESTAAVLR